MFTNRLLRSSENQEKYAEMYKVALNFGDRTVLGIFKKRVSVKGFLLQTLSDLLWGP
jgi:hypothetical protein